jgi:hypothetical protein
MVIGGGSTHEIRIESSDARIYIYQNIDRWVKIHIDDIPELIKELERISKDEK